MGGQRYCDAINGGPSRAMFDWERQEISCFLDEKKFVDMPKSDICRETGSNDDGWS